MQAVTSSCAGLSIVFDHGRAVSMHGMLFLTLKSSNRQRSE